METKTTMYPKPGKPHIRKERGAWIVTWLRGTIKPSQLKGVNKYVERMNFREFVKGLPK